MEKLLEKLILDFPDFGFISSNHFKWSPMNRTIDYDSRTTDKDSVWALFHELAHGVLDHQAYSLDVELLLMEAEAWHTAQELARRYDLKIDDNHIQDCLDTYRDWLDQRSTCPLCGNTSLQQSVRDYRCFNCQSVWQVSTSRFCRSYRQLVTRSQKLETSIKKSRAPTEFL